MKNVIVAFGLILGASLAHAEDVTDFKCQTTKSIESGHAHSKFSFSVHKMDKPRSIEYWVENEDDEPVRMTPRESAMMLNDNHIIRRTKKGLELSSDGDGCQFTSVVLYEDSGLTRGYLQIKDGGCGARPAYSTVTCTVKKR